MSAKKEKGESKKEVAAKKDSMDELRRKHPFETDSQIQNRYGHGREKAAPTERFKMEEGAIIKKSLE